MVINVDPQASVTAAQRHLDHRVGTEPRMQQRIGDELGNDQFGVMASFVRKVIEGTHPEPRLTHRQRFGRERESVDSRHRLIMP